MVEIIVSEADLVGMVSEKLNIDIELIEKVNDGKKFSLVIYTDIDAEALSKLGD